MTTARADFDEADRDLTAARRILDTAAGRYTDARRPPYDQERRERAYRAWALALNGWCMALANRELCKDLAEAERRDTDWAADVALLATPKDLR